MKMPQHIRSLTVWSMGWRDVLEVCTLASMPSNLGLILGPDKNWAYVIPVFMPGVGLMAGVVGLGSKSAEFKSRLAVEVIPGGVDTSLLVYCVRVATCPGLCPIAQETA